MDADGSGIHEVTQLAPPFIGEDLNPQWSPDGRRIVFDRVNVRSAEPVDGRALWILDLRTGREHRITPWELRGGDTPDWSPNGQWILFHDNTGNPDPAVSANLFKVRPNGRGLTRLTFETGGDKVYLGSSYSPDGRFIVTGRRPETGGNADILVMRADGSDARSLIQTQLYDSYPDWGPRPRRHR